MTIKNEIVKTIENHRLPTYNEIPNVGLYLEQTSKFINEYLEPIMDTSITGSMISNYVKKKLVINPVKKLYYREHIAQLIIIAIVKSVISLDRVKLIQKTDGAEQTEKLYCDFSKAFDDALKKVFGIPVASSGINEDTVPDKLLVDIVTTVAHKIYLEKLLASME